MKRPGAVVPPGECLAIRVLTAVEVDESESQQILEAPALFSSVEDLAHLAGFVPAIDSLWTDVEIAAHDRRTLGHRCRLEVVGQRLEPGQFALEILVLEALAVGTVETGEGQATDLRRQQS